MKKCWTSFCKSIKYVKVSEASTGSIWFLKPIQAANAHARNITMIKLVIQLNHPRIALIIINQAPFRSCSIYCLCSN